MQSFESLLRGPQCHCDVVGGCHGTLFDARDCLAIAASLALCLVVCEDLRSLADSTEQCEAPLGCCEGQCGAPLGCCEGQCGVPLGCCEGLVGFSESPSGTSLASGSPTQRGCHAHAALVGLLCLAFVQLGCHEPDDSERIWRMQCWASLLILMSVWGPASSEWLCLAELLPDNSSPRCLFSWLPKRG